MILASIGAAFGCWVLWILWKYRKLCDTSAAPLMKVVFKNQAEVVESLVRWLCQNPDVRLVVVDAGSTDDTPEILKRLSTRYGFLFEVEPKGYNVSGVE